MKKQRAKPLTAEERDRQIVALAYIVKAVALVVLLWFAVDPHHRVLYHIRRFINMNMDSFTPAAIGQLIAALTALVVAIGQVTVSIRNGKKVDENTAITKDAHQETTSKIDDLKTQVASSNTSQDLKK